MATTQRERLDREKQRVESLADDGSITTECRDALFELADALDEATVRHETTDGDGNTLELAPGTVQNYLAKLRIVATDHLDLLDTTAEEFNAAMDARHDNHDNAKTTLKHFQGAGKHFFRYFDGLGVDPDDIKLFSATSPPRHDEADLFTEGEVAALRRACGQSGWPVRNRALLELLIFTGQRITALITLRIKDVELNPPGEDNNSYIYLNDDHARETGGGLKGALVRGRKRPMFGARKYVRDWIEYHPEGDDPEAWLFVGDPSHWRTDPDDHLAKPTVYSQLSNIASAADVDKPVNAHNFRHYCCTVLYRDYDVDFDTIRMLLGHTKDSNTLETIYSHVLDEDFIESAEESLGYREATDRTPFTPDTCPTCGELLEEGWRQCPNCQEVFGPTEQVEEAAATIERDVTETALAEDLDADDRAALQTILDVVEEPADLAAKLAQLD